MHAFRLKILSGGLAFAAGLALASASRRPLYSFRHRTVLITGGSRGLGLELARQFARAGAALALLARDADELHRAGEALSAMGARVLLLPCDVCDRAQVAEAVERAASHFGRIDVLVNNAGAMQVGPLAHMSFEDFEKAMALHCFAPLATTLAVLPHLRREGEGRIVNIASIGGKVAVPHMLPYTASKFALVGLSDGLRAELRREKILVTTVCPGPMRTGSPRHATFKGQHRREYTRFALADSLPLLSINAETAARRIVRACRRGAGSLTLGIPTKVAVILNELAPGVVARAAATANRMLPGSDPAAGTRAIVGHESETALSRSFLTRLTHKAASRNNELPAGVTR